MLNKSIAYRLSIYISIAVVVVFLAIISLSYVFNKNLIIENVTNRAVGLSSQVIMKAEKYLISTREITSNISEQILYYEKYNDAELFISGIMQKYHFFNGIQVNIDSVSPDKRFKNYFAFRDSNSIHFESREECIYDCNVEKAILEELSSTDIAGWSVPYQCQRNGNSIVSYYSPIFITGENNRKIKVGEIISELSLLDLNDSINKIQIGDRGFAFLVAKDGTYITHPRKDWILNRNIYEISDKIYDKTQIDLKTILNSGLIGTTEAYPELLDYQKAWIYYAPVKEIGWSLIFVKPYTELFEPFYLVLLRMMFVSVLGILIVFLIITYITNKLIEPLSDITGQLRKFSNLSGEADIFTLNEIEQVSKSLDYLKAWYKKYEINQSKEKQKNNQRLQDLRQASEIQQSLMKTEFPAFQDRNNIELAGSYKPAKIVSGDLFDYFFIDDENLIITMGDVSGKGIPAAIFMSVCQTIIKGNSSFKMPKTIVNKANRELYTNNQHQFFLTLFLGVFNVRTGILNYCNAAHTVTYILKANGELVELNQSHGLPLGLYPDKDYADSRINMERGDSLILYTDGVIEQQDQKGFHFGAERFQKNIEQMAGKTPQIMVQEIENSLNTFKGSAAQNDDISLLILKYIPEIEKD